MKRLARKTEKQATQRLIKNEVSNAKVEMEAINDHVSEIVHSLSDEEWEETEGSRIKNMLSMMEMN